MYNISMRKKKKKLESIPKINRRLFKLWSEKVRARAKNTCEYCGKKVGDLSEEGKPLVKVDAHHLQSRKISNNPLKWDLRNAVCACPLHHKFSCNESFHRAPVITINWLMKNHPERFNYILEHFNDNIDLQNREVLKEIEKCLNEDLPLDIQKLKEIETANPRIIKNSKIEGNLFEEEKESSSSSSSED
jgi:hypothetical protein